MEEMTSDHQIARVGHGLPSVKGPKERLGRANRRRQDHEGVHGGATGSVGRAREKKG